MLAILAALILGGVIGGIVAIWTPGEDDGIVAGESEPETIPFTSAIPSVLEENTDTVFLVDVSSSIEESGNLDALRTALAGIALGDVHPEIGEAVGSSRVTLMTFADDTETVIPMGSLSDDVGRRNEWLVTAGNLETKAGTGTFIYDAVAHAHGMLMDTDSGARKPVIVLLSDGIDGDVGECRLATDNIERTRYCVGASGDPVLCDDLPADYASGGDWMICDAIPSKMDPMHLLTQLETDSENMGLTVHVVAYGSVSSHKWLRRVAQATEGQYIVAGR